MIDEVVELATKEIFSLEGLISSLFFQMGGFAAANLVVEDERNVMFLVKCFEALEIFMRSIGPSVYDDKGETLLPIQF